MAVALPRVRAAQVRALLPFSVGMAAQAVQYGSAVLLLLFVVTRLPKVDAEIWYVFVTIQGLATLADFGFQPTIARAFSAAYAGAREVRREGLDAVSDGAPNQALVAAIASASRRLYLALALGVAALLLTAGLAYIHLLVRPHPEAAMRVQVAWLAFTTATSASIYFMWVSPLLMGAERLSSNYLYVIVSKGGMALLGVIVLIAGGGIVALAASGIVATLLARVAVMPALAPLYAAAAATPPLAGEGRKTLRLLWPNAARLGATSFGAFLGTRLNVLILSSFVGLSSAASYAVTLQFLSAILAIGQLPTQMALPRLVKLRMERRLRDLWRLFLSRQGFLLLTALIGIGMLAAVGQIGLAAAGSKIRLLDQPLILALGVVLLLDFNHSNCGFFIASGNNIPFMIPIVASGAIAAMLAGAAAATGWGVAGVIAAQGAVQLAYNNWKWPLTLYRDIGPPAWQPR